MPSTCADGQFQTNCNFYQFALVGLASTFELGLHGFHGRSEFLRSGVRAMLKRAGASFLLSPFII